MFYYYNPLQTKSGDILPDYLVRLLDASGNEVDIFADNSGTPIVSVSGVANAAKADDLGMVRFWVPNGTYDIAIYDTTDTFKGREEGVPMFDAGSLTLDLSGTEGATLVGTPTGTVQDDIDARPTTATLAATGGAALIGSTDGDVQGDIDARPTTAALASSAGWGMVKGQQAGSDSVTRDIAEKFEEFLSTTDKGAVIDGATDDSDALIATFAQMAVTGRANLLSGTYKVTKPLTIPPGILEGGNVILDFSDADPADFPGDANGTCVTVQGGAMTQLSDLSADLAIGDRLMTFVSAHALEVGDSFNLSGTVDYAGNGARAYYRKGEMFRVAYVVDSTTVAVEGACRDTYPAADVEVWKRSGDSFTNGCASLTILAPDTIGQVIKFVNLDRSNIGRIRSEGGKWSAILATNCFGLFGDNIKARQVASGTDNYGIVIANCQGANLKGDAYGYFNGFTVGGGLTAGGLSGMSRDIHFEGTGASHPTGGLAGANLHGNCEYCSFRGVFANGVVMAGNKNEAHGEFIGRGGQPAVIFSGMHGHDFTVTGVARTIGADLSTSLAAIHQPDFGKIGGDEVTTARYGGRTKIDLQLYAENASRIITWRPSDLARSDVVLDLRLDIMKGHATTRLLIFSTNGSGNDFPLVEINRLNVLDTGPAISWSVATGTAFKNMRDEKTVTVSGSGAATYTQAVTFTLPFPRAPRCQTTINGPSIAGTSPIAETIKSVNASGGTVEISTTDKANQTVSTSVVVTAISQ